MVVVIHKNHAGKHDPARVIYIGRPSPLGNPYAIGPNISRNQAIEAYRTWLTDMIVAKNMRVMLALKHIYRLHTTGTAVLSCWCKPNACHGDVIKAYIEGDWNVS